MIFIQLSYLQIYWNCHIMHMMIVKSCNITAVFFLFCASSPYCDCVFCTGLFLRMDLVAPENMIGVDSDDERLKSAVQGL